MSRRCRRPGHLHNRHAIRPHTMAENLAAVPGLTPGQGVVRPLRAPIKPTGHIQILRGNLAPGGAVAK
ncbi:MAG: dihydroxy-acid dehydratase, partial [Gammaproteobacteria bacterium]